MLYRIAAAIALLFCLTLPAAAVDPAGSASDPLAAAAARMKVKDYNGARAAALAAKDGGGARQLLLGMAALRLELWDEAAANLAGAAQNYPLLADYALYNQGLALSKQGQLDQAFPPLYKLLKEYPESRLARPATLLYADSLFQAGYPKEALESYTRFIERYPTGSDALSAALGAALCREKLGDPAAAAGSLRALWLANPGSSVAEQAAKELRRLETFGSAVVPYSSAELFKRGSTLYDLGKYAQAAQALSTIPLAKETDEFAARVLLKTGQAQLKARRYQEAEGTLRALVRQGGSNLNEAQFWLAKSLDKQGRNEQAFELYLKLTQTPGVGSIADEALLEAAYLKRFQKKWDEALQLFKKYLATRPEAQQSPGVLWEAAWSSYQSRDYQGAAGYLKRLTGNDELREKALYWLAKSLQTSGDAKGAEAAYQSLAQGYPFGYYALICNRMCDIDALPQPPASLAPALPMPAGYEREKALIRLGLFDEAARELSAKKQKNPLGMARLYLEMENYNGALHAVEREFQKKSQREGVLWGASYPLAYRDEVVRHAAANGLPESLVYAIMRAESNYFPAARSPVGALGLMQIMPATAESISKGDSVNLTRPELNIRLGTRHLKDLMASYDRDIVLSAAAYNAGGGNVKRWQKSLAGLPRDEFIESIPFRETREYVKKVMATMELYQRLYRMQPAKN